MQDSTSFNVTVDSDDCMELYPDNKISNFRIRLPRTVHLNSSWRVGLADVTFSNSRFTFDRPQLIQLVAPATKTVMEIWIEPTLYTDVADLIADINEQLLGTVSFEKVPQIVYEDGVVRAEPGEFIGLQGKQKLLLSLSPTLRNILGLDRWGIPFLNARQSVIFLYCSIVKQRVVGDTSAKLMRTVDPSKGRTFGSVVSQVFRRIYFCQLDTYDFNEIEIQLLDDTGNEPLFKFGSFRVTLQFKQITE